MSRERHGAMGRMRPFGDVMAIRFEQLRNGDAARVGGGRAGVADRQHVAADRRRRRRLVIDVAHNGRVGRTLRILYVRLKGRFVARP